MPTGTTVIAPDDAENRALVDRVRPPAWTNPTPPSGRYNLVVIGGGTAGLVSAAATAGLGGTVALIERHLLGGDCLNVGCVPSKGIIRAARAAADGRAAAPMGVDFRELTIDFGVAMARMRHLRAKIGANDSAARFRDLGVDVYFGEARFAGRNRVEVAGQTLRFARAVIATGTRAHIPEIPGLADHGYLTNETLFELTALPPRLAILGGGPIGCEMAQTFARLGSEVHLFERGPRLLSNDDPAAAAVVAAALVRDGVNIHCDREVERVTSGPVLHAGNEAFDVDAILVATGRRPNLDALGLDAAGVSAGRAGVEVDRRLRTSNRRIYAAGDIASRFRFTHAADSMARIVVRNALFFGRASIDAAAMPWVTFTDPELAHVGLTPERAEAEGIAIDSYEVPMSDVDRAVLEGATEGFLRVHTRRGTDRIVGATLVSAHAGETIGELALAIHAGIGLGTISSAVHPYPTQALALQRAADAYARTRLRPWLARLFRMLLRWRRR